MALVAIMLLPTVASADTFDAAGAGKLADTVGINSTWVIVAGAARDVHAGRLRVPRDRLLARQERRHGDREGPDELLDRRALLLGRRLRVRVRRIGDIIGTHGFFLRDFGDPQTAFPIMGLSDATVEAKWFFQFVFCAVSLAIVWGTTLERIKFGVYVIYAVVFAGGDLPDRLGLGVRRRLAAGQPRHAGLRRVDGRPPDRCDGRPRRAAACSGRAGASTAPTASRGPIPGHNMPLFGLGIFILWLGWFGFNPGSTLNALDGRFTEVVIVTQLAACAGVLAAIVTANSRRRRSTSAWRATARSRRWSRSRLRRATSCRGRRS